MHTPHPNLKSPFHRPFRFPICAPQNHIQPRSFSSFSSEIIISGRLIIPINFSYGIPTSDCPGGIGEGGGGGGGRRGKAVTRLTGRAGATMPGAAATAGETGWTAGGRAAHFLFLLDGVFCFFCCVCWLLVLDWSGLDEFCF